MSCIVWDDRFKHRKVFDIRIFAPGCGGNIMLNYSPIDSLSMISSARRKIFQHRLGLVGVEHSSLVLPRMLHPQ